MEQKKESETTENIVAFAVFGIIILLIVGFFTNGFGLFNKGEEVQRVNVGVGNDPVRGDISKAKVVLITYSDYECPFCQIFEATLAALETKYGEDLVVVFKNFPLSSIHPNAMGAALAAECSLEQGKYWEYHDKLFANNQNLTIDALKQYASDIGLNSTEFNACLDSQRYSFEVSSDQSEGTGLGVRSTPTSFVNGIPVIGSQPQEVLEQIIDAELKG